MLIRKGVKLLEEKEGAGDLVQRQREYFLSIRLALNNGAVLDARPWEAGMRLGQSEDGFFEHRKRIDRCALIPGLFYAVQGMRIGGYRKVAISPHLAYGEKGVPDQIPPNAKLVAEIKVLRAVPPGKVRWQEPETLDTGLVTQDDLCRRYDITQPTLWRWRKAGRLPAPVLVGTAVRWKPSALERWETEGRPVVSPSLDEARKGWDQAFAAWRGLPLAARNNGQSDLIKPSPSQRKEQRRIMQEIDGLSETMLDLTLELALLIDEAGLWHGPPLEKLLKDGDAAGGHWRNLLNILEKTLADPESPSRERTGT
jgi:predicted DNA-binding transcriptional regulator AlpA